MGIDAEIDTSQGGDIIQTLKDEIFCSICCAIFEVRFCFYFKNTALFKEPLKLDCCDGHLCKVCFEDVKPKFASCPLCRASNYSAKPSRLMVSVLSTITLSCPAEECSEKFLYSQFLKHKETCDFLNMKTCDQCNVKMDLPEFERHLACIKTLLKNLEEVKKKNECQKKSFNALHAKHVKTLNENKVNIASVNSLNISLNRSNDVIRQLQLANDDKAARLHQLQFHNQTGGAQNNFLAAENEKLQKSLKDLNSNMAKLQRDSHIESYNLKEENRMLRNKYNSDVTENQSKIKNLEAEAKTAGARNHFLGCENEKLQKSINDLNAKITKLQRDHHLASYNMKEENRILQNSANEKSAQIKKTGDQSNRIKNLEAEAKNLKQSIEQHKKNAAAAKKKTDETLKKAQTKSNIEINTLKNEMKQLRSNYDHLSDLFCEGGDTDNCKSCKSGAIDSLLPKVQAEKEKKSDDKIKNLETKVANLTKTVATQREQHKSAKKELEGRITQSYELKICDLEAALQNKVGPLEDALRQVSSDKSALQANVLELQKQAEFFEKGTC